MVVELGGLVIVGGGWWCLGAGCVVGGGWWLVLGCKPILVISLNLSQAEQFGFD